MTTSKIDLTAGPAADWWALRDVEIRPDVVLLRIAARTPAVRFGELFAAAYDRVPQFRAAKWVLVCIGNRFDRSKALNVELAKRRTVWSEVALNGSDAPGEAILDATLHGGEWGACWGLRYVSGPDIGPALDLCRRAPAIIVTTTCADTENWARRLVLGEDEQLPDADTLFRRATSQLKVGDLVARGRGIFADPVEIEIVGDMAQLGRLDS